MRTLIRAALVAAVMMSLAGAAQAQTLSSSFDSDSEGWTIVDYDPNGHNQPQAGSPLPHDPGVGNPAGSVRAGDVFLGTAISAPASYLGDRRSLFGGALEFDLYPRYVTVGSLTAVTLVSSTRTLFYVDQAPPVQAWSARSAPFLPGDWHVNSYVGTKATSQDLLEVLSDLQALWITTEWAVGPDDTNVDNARLVPSSGGSVAIFGSGINLPGSIKVISGSPQLGTTLKLGLTNPSGSMSPGSLTFLAISLDATPAFPAGLQLPGFGMASAGTSGELLIDIAASSLAVPIQAGPPFHGTGQYVSYTLPVPLDVAFVGLTVYAQGLLLDPIPSPWMGLTDAAMITLGT